MALESAPTGIYTQGYYDDFADSSQQSAALVLPQVISLLRSGTPASVIDLGCGVGGWLEVWRSLGATHIHGVDGTWARDGLRIPAEYFEAHDLASGYQPHRRYDLAMSVESGEHLAEPAADLLVDALVAAAPVILFSAAIPYQPGTHHVNCQWPSYWARKFSAHGYVCIDALRPLIWMDDRVDWWYRQNIMLFAATLDHFRNASASAPPLSLVHPEMLMEMRAWGIEQQRRLFELSSQMGTAG